MHFWRSNSWRKKEKEEEKKKKWFLETGSTFLEKLIADCDGKSIPIRMFSSDQILSATNNFDPSCSFSYGWIFTWYKGCIEDRVYAIKKYGQDGITSIQRLQVRDAYNDIVISIRVSNHPNFLRVLGCCLEFPLPVLVFEYADNGVLNEIGGIGGEGGPLLPWTIRVKIATGIAEAVTYLHMAFPRIIIHRDIKLMNILLHRNWTAKLTDFSASISLPEGKTWTEDVPTGTIGYIDPSYCRTSVVTEYTDVYSFGTLLMVFLTGRPAFPFGNPLRTIHAYVKDMRENGQFTETVDPEMAEDTRAHQRLQMEAFRKLALRCCEDREEDRPNMIQVAKELKQIERSSLHATFVRSTHAISIS